MNQQKPKLSIILPVYNVEEYLAECLNTVLTQVFIDFEILLVNDGSKDRSGEICDQYAEKDPRVKVVHQQNQGVSAARNRGIENASGEFVTFIDPDDYLTSENVYSTIFSVINNDIDVVHFGFERKNQEGNYIPPVGGKLSKNEMLENLFPIFVGNKTHNFRKIFVMSPVYTLVIRRSLIIDNNIVFQPIKRTEDKLFFLEVLLVAEKIFVFQETFYFYRVNPTSATQNYNPDFLQEMDFSQNYQKNILKKQGVYDAVHEEFENSVLYQFYSGIMNETRVDNLKESLAKILNFERSQKIREILTWSKTNILAKQNPLWLLIKMRQYGLLMKIYPYYRKLK